MQSLITAALILTTVSLVRNEKIGLINNDYAFKMHRTLISEDSNVLTSPISYLNQLGILQLASDGETSSEIRRSVGYDATSSGDKVLNFFYELNSRLRNQSKNAFKMANVIVLRSDFSPAESCVMALEHFYNASVQLYDIHKATETMRVTNKLIRDVTGGAFQQFLVSPLDSYNRLAMLNAIYLSGMWKYQFQYIEPGHFYNRGKLHDFSLLPMMSVQGSFPFATLHPYGTKMTAVELPYADDDLKVLLLLPDSTGMHALIRIEQQITGKGLSSVLNSMEEKVVNVTLPSFELQPGHDLMWSIQFLGIHHAFNNAANFRRLSEGKGLFVTKVLHKMIFEMNANGAAAPPFYNKAEEQFVANRPFLFFIRDTKTEMVLFMGRIVSLASK